MIGTVLNAPLGRVIWNVSRRSSPGEILRRGDSLITSRPGGRWVYRFFVILRDGKLGGGWNFIKVRDITVKNFNEGFLLN